jgi:hypothetical protein
LAEEGLDIVYVAGPDFRVHVKVSALPSGLEEALASRIAELVGSVIVVAAPALATGNTPSEHWLHGLVVGFAIQ